MSRQQEWKTCSVWVCGLVLSGWVGAVNAHHVIVETD